MRALSSRAASVAAVAFAATPLSRAFLYKLCILVNYRLGVSPQELSHNTWWSASIKRLLDLSKTKIRRSRKSRRSRTPGDDSSPSIAFQ